MVIGLLWIIGVFGLCAVLVHGSYWLQRKTLDKTVHVVLVTFNNQTQIEWYLRSFLWLSWVRGRSIYVTVFDAGSTDETVAIVQKLAAARENIHVELSTEGISDYLSQRLNEEVIFLQLMSRTAEDGWLIPHW
jgi:uncharacterized protein (UPF0276 family)